MTAVAVARRGTDGARLAVVWFLAGVVVSLCAAHVASAAAANPHEPSPLLVRSTCAGITLYRLDGEPRHVATLHEPGLYELTVLDDRRAARLGPLTGGRPLAELPLGADGERLLPSAWCTDVPPLPAGLIGPGLGP